MRSLLVMLWDAATILSLWSETVTVKESDGACVTTGTSDVTAVLLIGSKILDEMMVMLKSSDNIEGEAVINKELIPELTLVDCTDDMGDTTAIGGAEVFV